ncbi:MAG TPA: helix-turn-helix transcriptional regulator [Spirochaetia bacterium]
MSLKIPTTDLDLLGNLIRALYTRPFGKELVDDARRTICRVADIQYFSLYVFPGGEIDSPLVFTNNPPDYMPTYFTVAGRDFLLDSLVESGREIVLRRLPGYDEPSHTEFIETVQKARPISDIVYIPIPQNGFFRGFWSFDIAGLYGRWFSDSEIELCRFLAGFLNDAFHRSLVTPLTADDVAYLDSRGEVIDAGPRIREAFDEIFGQGRVFTRATRSNDLAAAFHDRFFQFLHGPFRPGMDRVSFTNRNGRYSFLFRALPDIWLPPRFTGFPRASVQLLESPSVGMMQHDFDLSLAVLRYGLTPRECEIIHGVYAAKSNKVIARELGIDESTVKRHTHNIYEKTGLRSRVELVQNLMAGAHENQPKL